MFIKTKQKIKCIVAFLFCIIIVSSVSITVAAQEELQSPAYTNYYYEIRGDEKILVEDRPVYGFETVIDGNSLKIDGFFHVNDMCDSKNGDIYVLDSGNSRVVVLNSDGTLNRVISDIILNGEKCELKEPQGIFVSDNNEIFISDTEGERILICDDNGVVNKTMTVPKSDLIPDDFKFNPISVLIDNSGYLNVLTRGSYYGAMLYDEEYEFVGFFGANSVQGTVLDNITALFNSIFETNKKKAQRVRKIPYQFYDFDCDKTGFIYTISPTEKGQIKKINLKGSNVLRLKKGLSVVSAESYNFADTSTYVDEAGHKLKHAFSKIAVDENGYVYALDSAYGQVYVYDDSCNVITVFGGGLGRGDRNATFVTASSIVVVNGKIWISDYEKNSITVLSKTEYGDLVMKAQNETVLGNFDAAESLWGEVLKYNSNHQLAYRGLGLAAINKRDYDAAMKYSKMGYDQETYAAAYGQVMNKFLNKHLWWILLIIVVLLVFVVVWFSRPSKRDEYAVKKTNQVVTALKMCVHPIEVAGNIRTKQSGSVIVATVILALYYLSSVSVKTWSGFMYTLPAQDFNLLYTLLGSVGIVILWVLCHWGVSTIFSGKGSFKAIYIVTCYCLIPLIVYNVLFIALSYIVVPSSTSFVDILSTIAYLYVAIMLVSALINIQEYGLAKLSGVVVLSVAGMVGVAFLLFMTFILGQNFVSFFANIISEGMYR